jgi:hypothetical protein
MHYDHSSFIITELIRFSFTVCISYAWVDGASLATRLYDGLEQTGIKCFLIRCLSWLESVAVRGRYSRQER